MRSLETRIEQILTNMIYYLIYPDWNVCGHVGGAEKICGGRIKDVLKV